MTSPLFSIKHLLNRSESSILFQRSIVNRLRQFASDQAKFISKREKGVFHMNNPLPHDHGGSLNLHYVRSQLGQTEHFEAVAHLFAQLGDATRIRIFWLLCHREECVLNISALMDMSSPAISHHLKALRDCGLLESRRDGKEVYYKTSDSPACHLLHKVVEQVMEITCPPQHATSSTDTARQIHSYLMEHLSERITIEELSRQFHINTTTLKESFKQVYGTSIAAHVNKHRMEQAAKLLKSSDHSILEIAQSVGFQSQSRFTAAFKKEYNVLPSEYRKG